MTVSAVAVPLAIAWMSVCMVDTAKRITEVVKLSEDLTCMIGNIPESTLVTFSLAVSSIVTDFAAITLSRALVTKASVSISTLVSLSVYSFSISSVIALK